MKKFILSLAAFFIVLQLVAQPKTVKIHGIVKDSSVKSIEIGYPADPQLSKRHVTKVNVENGRFKVSLQIPFPSSITISHGNRIFSDNYIYSDAEIVIDSVGEPHVIGSPLHDEYQNEFLPFFKTNDRVWDTLRNLYGNVYKKYGDDIPQTVKDSVIRVQDKYYYGRAALLEKYIKQHPGSYVALWDIGFFASLFTTHRYFDFEKLFSSFSDQIQRGGLINALKERIKGSSSMQAGQKFPEEFFKGHEQMLNNIRKNSQYYLIDFWYIHCGFCIEEFPRLKEIYNKYHSKGFDIVSISIDKQKDKKGYFAAIKKYDLIWNHIWDKDGIKARKFNISIFPTYILLNKDGRIINSNIRAGELEAFLKDKL